MMYDEEFVNALYRLYQKFWNEIATMESDSPKYAYIGYDDLIELEEICVEIERLDS